MENRIRVYVWISLLMGPCCVAAAQNTAGIPLKPGERLIAIDGVPVGRVPHVVKRQVSPTRSPASAQKAAVKPAGAQKAAVNIVGNLTRSNLPFSHTPGATALEKANAERRRYGKNP